MWISVLFAVMLLSIKSATATSVEYPISLNESMKLPTFGDTIWVSIVIYGHTL